MTFSEYVMGYRLQMAKKWLVETEMTIKEIAERLQYHNPQNFIRSFRKKEHVTPGAYRALRQDK
ncbi:DNA-binding transcriptional regulator SoxS [compost metagenome]